MKFSSIFSKLVCTVAVVHGLGTKDIKQFESLREIPPGWQSIGSPEPDTRMAFKIALKLVCEFSSECAQAYMNFVTNNYSFPSSCPYSMAWEPYYWLILHQHFQDRFLNQNHVFYHPFLFHYD